MHHLLLHVPCREWNSIAARMVEKDKGGTAGVVVATIATIGKGGSGGISEGSRDAGEGGGGGINCFGFRDKEEV